MTKSDTPAGEVLREALTEADIDGYGDEGEGYDFDKMAEKLHLQGWHFGSRRGRATVPSITDFGLDRTYGDEGEEYLGLSLVGDDFLIIQTIGKETAEKLGVDLLHKSGSRFGKEIPYDA